MERVVERTPGLNRLCAHNVVVARRREPSLRLGYLPEAVVAIGSAITSPDKYEKYAVPGIELAKEEDTQVLSFSSTGTLFRSYNLILDQAAKIDDLEFLVLIHQDAEIIDPDFIPKIRDAMKDPDVALVGCAGAVGVRSIAWWEGAVTWASFTHHYEELGGGEIPALTWLAETPLLREARRGRHDRRLRHRLLALGDPEPPVRRDHRRRPPRIRLRHLPPGPRQPARKSSPPTSRWSTTTRSS